MLPRHHRISTQWRRRGVGLLLSPPYAQCGVPSGPRAHPFESIRSHARARVRATYQIVLAVTGAERSGVTYADDDVDHRSLEKKSSSRSDQREAER